VFLESLIVMVRDGDGFHPYMRPWVGDGRGRSREQAGKDERWCEAVAEFVS